MLTTFVLRLSDATLNPTADSGLSTVQVASVLVGVFLPILVGLVTKTVTSSSVKALLLALLSAVTGFLTEFINSGNFVWQQALLSAVVTFVTAVAFHFGLWSPTGTSAKAQRAFGGDNS